jgi:hypothetical protein
MCLFILAFTAIGCAQALVFPAAAIAAAAHFDVIEIAANALMVVGAAHYVAADGLSFFHDQNLLVDSRIACPGDGRSMRFIGMNGSFCGFSL